MSDVDTRREAEAVTVKRGSVDLRAKVGVLRDISGYIIGEAAGKSVLNVGAAGGVELYLPDRRNEWLHHRLAGVARELIGVDIDTAAIARAARYGVEILQADCQSLKLGTRFDRVVMSDVIEHLDAPGVALRTLVEHLVAGGRLLVTTPNPTHYGTLVRAAFGRSPSVYYDHTACFLPEHLQAMCDRYGYRLSEVYFFGHIDRRSLANIVKSRIGRAAGTLSHRLYSSFLACIER